MSDEGEHGERRSDSTAAAALPRDVTLNLDTLEVVLSHLPRADLLSASSTSRVIRDLAILELLSRPQEVVYGDSSRFRSWCDFVLADDKRPACIRDLSLLYDGDNWTEYDSEDDAEDLQDTENPQEREDAEDSEGSEAPEDSDDADAERDKKIHELGKIARKPAELVLDVLRRATCLQRLSIAWADGILGAVPGIPLAISRLPALKFFSVNPYSVNAQHAVSDVLATMQSRLTSLSLLCVTYRGGRDSEQGAWDYDLPRALAPHLGHLESLYLGFPDGRTPQVRSTTLHTLKMPLGENGPSPRELFEAFPNLRSLCLNYTWHYLDPLNPTWMNRFPQLRDRHISEQRGGRVWVFLDTLRGSLLHIYVLGLTCPVRRLEMQYYLPASHHKAVDIVRCACPQKLVLEIQCCTTRRATTVPQPSLLVPESPDRPHVTHLTVRILFCAPVPSTQGLIDDLLPLLQDSKVEYLRLAIGGRYMQDDNLEDNWILDSEDWVRKCVRRLDLDLLRNALVGAATMLRVLAFTIVIRGQIVWTVDRSGGTTTTTEVDPVVARELIQREEA